MCGIAGSLGSAGESEAVLRRMAGAIAHRGPDDEGVWLDAAHGVGFAHRRLSIIDTSAAGHQPMLSSDGRFVIAYNGEIYNHLDLRAELERVAVAPAWRGHSDTETLLAGFSHWGTEQTLQRAVGMFAIALWDRRERRLMLARDRLGEKPLYYAWSNGTLLFGSELKALRAHPGFRAEIDRSSLATFMRYGYVPAPRSIYRDVFKLPPGTLLQATPGEAPPQPSAYWSLLEIAQRGLARPFEGSAQEAIDELETKLMGAVSAQQIADVPIGAFLSGGVDSSLIVALMQKQASRPIRTFTIGFESARYNEADHAKAVASHLGTQHTDLIITPAEALAVIPKLPDIYDEPFADSSQVPTCLVSQLARRHVTVSLSGDGGDELFGGYNRYLWAPRVASYPRVPRRMLSAGMRMLSPSAWDSLHDFFRPVLPKGLRFEMAGDKAHKLAAVLAEQSVDGIYGGLVSTWTNTRTLVPSSDDRHAPAEQWRRVDDIPLAEQKMMALDAVTYLPDDILCKVDRAAMAVSLETRVPYLDHRVVEFAWRLPLALKLRKGEGSGKWILRQLLDRHVPRALIERPKMGFGVPIDEWLRGPLRPWAEELLDETRLAGEAMFDPAQIGRKWREHVAGRRNWQYPLWNVLMFQSWYAAQRRGA